MLPIRTLALLLALAPAATSAQAWTRLAGGPAADAGTGVAPMPDGGILAVGWSQSFAPGQQAYAVRTDAFGDTLWTRVLDRGPYSERAYDAIPTDDGGALIIGVAYVPEAASFRPWVVRLDADGGVRFETGDGLTQQVPVRSGVVRGALRADGALVLAGGNSSTTSPQALWFAVVDPADGSLISFRQLPPLLGGFGVGTYVDAVQATPDGGFALGGQVGNGTGEAFLWKFDADTDSAWVRTYRPEGLRVAFSTRVTPDGGFVLAGCSIPNCADARVVRTDAQGTPLWSRTYADSLTTEARDIAALDDGSYLLLRLRIDAVGTQSFDTDLVEIGPDGDFLGATRFPGGASDPDGEGSVRLNRLVPVGAGTWFTAVGERARPGGLADTDLYIVRDVSGQRSVSATERPTSAAPLRLAPNPATGLVRLFGTWQPDAVEVFDAMGRQIRVPVDGTTVDVRGLAPGAYVLRASGTARMETLRFVVAR